MTADVPNPGLLVERLGACLRLTLNRPEQRNAVDRETEALLIDTLRDIEGSTDVRVVVLTGAGKAFCAGGDIRRNVFLQANPSVLRQDLRNARQLIDTLLSVEQPIIARIQGDAVGLGATLALFCDITVMAERARIGDPHVLVALAAGDGGAAIWPNLIGYARARRYLLGGELLNAQEAVAMGLVNYALPDDDLDRVVAEWVDRFSKGAPLALRGTKAALNANLRANLDHVMSVGLLHEEITYASQDVVEAADAFLSKRAPVFKGS